MIRYNIEARNQGDYEFKVVHTGMRFPKFFVTGLYCLIRYDFVSMSKYRR